MITSADCKKAIIQKLSSRLNLRAEVDPELLNPTYWKRISKKGNATKGFVRIFRNIKTNLTLNVHATEEEITEIKQGTFIKKSQDKETGILEVCKKAWTDELNGVDKEYFRGAPWDLPWQSLPKIGCDSDDSDNKALLCCDQDLLNKGEFPGFDDGHNHEEYCIEEIDFENYDILELDDQHILISCGGDWQWPITFKGMLKDGKLVFEKESIVFTQSHKSGLKGQQIKSILEGKC